MHGVYTETFIKLLLPSYVAGLIIGKDGAEITHLMQTTGAGVKFSPGRELYPGTQDRVCVITGNVNSIVSTLKSIYQRIADNERVKSDTTEIIRQLKMLVSNIASGMVIGKSGQNVKLVQQECNVRIQISSKEDSGGLPERIHYKGRLRLLPLEWYWTVSATTRSRQMEEVAAVGKKALCVVNCVWCVQ